MGPLLAGSKDDFSTVLSPGRLASGISGSQAEELAAGNVHHKQVTGIGAEGPAYESDLGAVAGEGGGTIKLLVTRRSERASR